MLHGAHREDRVARQTEGEQRQRRRAPRLRDAPARAPGSSTAAIPRAKTPATSTAKRISNGRTRPAARAPGAPRAPARAPPSGSVAPPVKATTPLFPTRTPGVVGPWRQSSAAITENAQPTRTARPSFARTPATTSAIAVTTASRRAERDAEEVNATGRGHLLAADEVQHRGEGRRRRRRSEDRDRAISHRGARSAGRRGSFRPNRSTDAVANRYERCAASLSLDRRRASQQASDDARGEQSSTRCRRRRCCSRSGSTREPARDDRRARGRAARDRARLSLPLLTTTTRRSGARSARAPSRGRWSGTGSASATVSPGGSRRPANRSRSTTRGRGQGRGARLWKGFPSTPPSPCPCAARAA